MQTRIRFEQVRPLPVLAVEIELPTGFECLPVDVQRQLVEQQMTRALETTQRILSRRLAGAA